MTIATGYRPSARRHALPRGRRSKRERERDGAAGDERRGMLRGRAAQHLGCDNVENLHVGCVVF